MVVVGARKHTEEEQAGDGGGGEQPGVEAPARVACAERQRRSRDEKHRRQPVEHDVEQLDAAHERSRPVEAQCRVREGPGSVGEAPEARHLLLVDELRKREERDVVAPEEAAERMQHQTLEGGAQCPHGDEVSEQRQPDGRRTRSDGDEVGERRAQRRSQGGPRLAVDRQQPEQHAGAGEHAIVLLEDDRESKANTTQHHVAATPGNPPAEHALEREECEEHRIGGVERERPGREGPHREDPHRHDGARGCSAAGELERAAVDHPGQRNEAAEREHARRDHARLHETEQAGEQEPHARRHERIQVAVEQLAVEHVDGLEQQVTLVGHDDAAPAQRESEAEHDCARNEDRARRPQQEPEAPGDQEHARSI